MAMRGWKRCRGGQDGEATRTSDNGLYGTALAPAVMMADPIDLCWPACWLVVSTVSDVTTFKSIILSRVKGKGLGNIRVDFSVFLCSRQVFSFY